MIRSHRGQDTVERKRHDRSVVQDGDDEDHEGREVEPVRGKSECESEKISDTYQSRQGHYDLLVSESEDGEGDDDTLRRGE